MADKIVANFATMTTRYGDFEETNALIIEHTSEEELHTLAREERGSDESDWDEDMGGYWFDGYMVFLPVIHRGITQEEVDLFNQANNLKYSFMGKG